MKNNDICTITKKKIKKCCGINKKIEKLCDDLLNFNNGKEILNIIDGNHPVFQYMYHNMSMKTKISIPEQRVTPLHYFLSYFLNEFNISEHQVSHSHLTHVNSQSHINKKTFLPDLMFYLSAAKFKYTDGIYSGAICNTYDIKLHKCCSIRKTITISARFKNNVYGYYFDRNSKDVVYRTNCIHFELNFNNDYYHCYPKISHSDMITRMDVLLKKEEVNELYKYREALSKIKLTYNNSSINTYDFLIQIIQRTKINLNIDICCRLLPENTCYSITNSNKSRIYETTKINDIPSRRNKTKRSPSETDYDDAIEIIKVLSSETSIKQYDLNDLLLLLYAIKDDHKKRNSIIQLLCSNSFNTYLFKTIVTLWIRENRWKENRWKENEENVKIKIGYNRICHLNYEVTYHLRDIIGLFKFEKCANEHIIGYVDLYTLSFEKTNIKMHKGFIYIDYMHEPQQSFSIY